MNSDYSQLADVANQERIREYDYGPGVGGAVELYLQRKNLPLVTARYRYSYLNVSNGSIYNGETASGAPIGLDSTHDVHQVEPEARDPDRPVADGRRRRLDLPPAQPLRRHGGHPGVRGGRAPDDHAEEPRGPRLRGLDLQPLKPARLSSPQALSLAACIRGEADG